MINLLEDSPIIAAVRYDNDFEEAIKSPLNIIFLLSSNITNLKDKIDNAHQKGKKIFVHIDFCDGLGKDIYGLKFIKSLNADGFITTKNNLVIAAKEIDLTVIQRIFIIDSLSVSTALDSIKYSKPDLIEIMPGLIPFAIKKFISSRIPLIAGGLIQNKQNIMDALEAGASSVSTAKKELWYL